MKRSRRSRWHLQCLLAAGVLLVSCGGGGGGGDPPAPPPAFSRADLVRGLACTGPGETGWCWAAPRPWGNRVLDVRFVDALNGWAVGEAGMVLRTTDGGVNWVRTRQAHGAFEGLSVVRFADPQHGWALGFDGVLLHSVDGGRNWIDQGGWMLPGTWSRLTVVDRDRLVVGGSPQGPWATWVSLDAGVRFGLAGGGAGFADVTPAGRLWDFDVDRVRRSLDFGRSTETLAGREGFGANRLFGDHHVLLYRLGPDRTAAGSRLHLSRDGGDSWTVAPPAQWEGADVVPAGMDADGRALARVNPVQGGDRLLRSVDDGRSWSPAAMPQALVGRDSFEFIEVLDGHQAVGFVGGDSWLTRDGGLSWRTLSAGGPGRAARLAGGAGLVLAGRDGRLWTTPDGGITVRPIPGGPVGEDAHFDILGLWFFDLQRGLAIGTTGLLDTADGGRTWSARPPDPAECSPPSDLHFADASRGWRVGCGRVQLTTDGGRSWTVPATSPADVAQLQFVDGSRGWATTAVHVRVDRFGFRCEGSLWTSVDGGQTWSRVTTPQSGACLRIAAGPGGQLVASDGSGALWRSPDGGLQWQSAVLAQNAGAIHAAKAQFIGNDRVWLGTGDGRLLRSDDGGRSWAAVPLPALRSPSVLSLRFADAQYGWVSMGNGQLIATQDGGNSWQMQGTGSAFSAYAIFALDASTVWLGGSGKSVLVSVQGGR